MQRIRIWLWAFGVYMSVATTITFSQFILEEAFQTTMFSSWPAGDVAAWGVVKNSLIIMKSINRTLKIVTYSVGWIQPLGFVSYRAYSQSADAYILALKTKVLTNEPNLFVGEEIELKFSIKMISKDKKGKSFTNFKQIFVEVGSSTTIGDVIDTKGVLRKIEGRLVLKPS